MTAAFDAIVVLGAAIRADGTPSAALVRRIDHGIHLYKQGRAPALLVTGGPVTGPPAEARLMAELARRAGVPEDAIVVEDAAATTYENARFSAAIMAARGWRRALVVSDGHHLPRALLSFRAAGVRASGSAVPGVFAAGRLAYLRAAAREAVACAAYGWRLARERWVSGGEVVAER